jgi:hypothetical protein
MKISRESRSFATPNAATNERSANGFGDFHSFVQRNTGEHLLSGSYVVTSVPRSIFVMIRGSQDEDDSSVVWCNPKNSNGPMLTRSAWERRAAGFVALTDFDWGEFNKPPECRLRITLDQPSL